MECAMKKSCKCIVITLFLFSFFFVLCSSVNAGTVWVDDDFHYPHESDGTLSKPYATIQAAINAANHGDIIKILPGTYNENIVVDKSLSLRTDSAEETIITSNKKEAYLVDIQASDVSIEEFTLIDETNTSHRKAVFHIAPDVQDVVISENRIFSTVLSRCVLAQQAEGIVIRDNIFNNSSGIQFENCDSCSIADNIIYNTTDQSAIRIIDSTGTVIIENTIEQAMHGIYLLSCSDSNITSNIIQDHISNGISLEQGEDINIKNNTIKNNGLTGIKLSCKNSNIQYNTITDNNIGINIGSDNNKIFNNTIKNNLNYGIFASLTSYDNIIFENTIRSERDYILASDEGSNQWDFDQKGNFWSDYLGPDNNEDGIGDIVYSKHGMVDHYPLGKFQKPPIVSNPDPSHLAENVDLHPTLSVTVEDPENKRLDVSFYYLLDNESYLIDTVNNVESGSKASVAFYSTIQGENAVYTYLGTGYDYIGLWYVTAKDTYSNTTSDSWIFSTKNVPVNNEPPTPVITCKKSGETDEPFYFNASKSTDTDGTIAFYRWSFGDGLTIVNDKTPTHQFSEPGTYNISLVVIDDNGSSASTTKQVSISNQRNDPPQAEVNGPYFAKENTYISLTSTGTYDPDADDELSYQWMFGDGNTSSTKHPTYKYKNGGNYTVTLTVTDSDGLSDSQSTYALIASTKKESTPGFEFILILLGILFVIGMSRKKKN